MCFNACLFPRSLSTVYDLLTSPDCLPDLLQGGLAEQGVTEAFILATFKLQPRTGTTVFGLYNPRDNSKYFEFTVMGKLNRGKRAGSGTATPGLLTGYAKVIRVTYNSKWVHWWKDKLFLNGETLHLQEAVVELVH